ncbi:hypothetical protein RclHR1_09160007 [Rhizophagus clarus]|uniref:Uncharacterized protein n=1 Tax=Rhizophagus clarus TaxID=94130 RepID=A0A2Z6SQ16_9GLOM|nr:hypothetical protein RclHR1_09160007 [Rhizophagus clarus]GET04577.1 hypothetical protein GLOIN_2v1482917 [Rhizophagus clarus]
MTLLNNIRKKFIRCLLLTFLIIIINGDLLVLEGSKLPGKIFNEAGEGVDRRPERKIGKTGSVPGSVLDNIGKSEYVNNNNNNNNNFNNDKVYEGNKEEVNKGVVKTENPDILTISIIITIVLIIIISIYVWFKRRNRNRNKNTSPPDNAV